MFFALGHVLALATTTTALKSDPKSGIQNIGGAVEAILGYLPTSFDVTPQIIRSALSPIEAILTRNSPVQRDGTSLSLLGEKYTASGANVYWLGLDENVIPPAGEPFYAPLSASYPTKGRTTEVMATLVTMGAKLIRSQTLGVSTGNPLSLMPSLGVYNDAAFESIDWAVFQARQHGLRIMAPLTDNYDYYHGGKFNFLRWAGFNITGSESPLPQTVQQFYTNATIVSSFKAYVTYLLNHTNPYTGLTYAADPTILGYETGNELGGPVFGDMNVPTEWVRDICQLVKSLGPDKLCIDGTYGINLTHFAVSEIDIFSDHFYPLNNTKLEADITAVESANRVYLAGEIAWTESDPNGSSLASFYDAILKHQNSSSPVVAGSLFWSFFGHNVPDCGTFVNHSDGLTLQYGNPANSNATNARISTIREHYFAMQNITVDGYLPTVACPHNYIPGYEAEFTYY